MSFLKFAILAFFLGSNLAKASVIYSGTIDFRIFPFGPDSERNTQVNFSFSTPDFITANYLPGFAVVSASNSFLIQAFEFVPTYSSGGSVFDMIDVSVFRPDANAHEKFLFPLGSFGAVGVYAGVQAPAPGTVFADSTLRVTGAPDVAAVPEPATWTTLILGLCGMGAAVRRRKISPTNTPNK